MQINFTLALGSGSMEKPAVWFLLALSPEGLCARKCNDLLFVNTKRVLLDTFFHIKTRAWLLATSNVYMSVLRTMYFSLQ